MQYHLNGFRPGDPRIAPAEAPIAETDVAIIGSGPAGLTLAAQLAKIGGISVRIFEQRNGPLQVGQADGIACRSMEMFQAFGFAERVLAEAYFVNETAFWRPGPNGLHRADRIQDVEDDLSEMPHVILNQARVHDFFLDAMQQSASRLTPDYAHRLTNLARQSDHIEATFDTPTGPQTIRTRYLVGCDGARSAVRKWMGHRLKGEAARQLWGVMDVLCVTTFPDIRLKCAIQSAEHGSMLIIPREGGYLVRLYIELDELHGDERAADRNVTPEMLETRARAILAPYDFAIKDVAWCSAYEIGQRVCDTFDDATQAGQPPRVFIAGDACHTHSPKAGQGMNVSMADTFNLGWKLAAVIRGEAKPDILHSYSAERRAKAKELIDFDRDMARLFSTKPSTKAQSADFQRYFQTHGRYTAGVETTYAQGPLVSDATHQSLATGLTIGKRFHSAPVIRLADAKPMQLGHVALADGRWRLFAFAPTGDTGAPNGPLATLCDTLQSDASFLSRYPGPDPDSRFDLRAIFQQPHRDLNIAEMPPLLLPKKGKHGLIDYEKIFCPNLKSGQDIFDLRGINRQTGALIVTRPDQYISHVLPLDAALSLNAYFDSFML